MTADNRKVEDNMIAILTEWAIFYGIAFAILGITYRRKYPSRFNSDPQIKKQRHTTAALIGVALCALLNLMNAFA